MIQCKGIWPVYAEVDKSTVSLGNEQQVFAVFRENSECDFVELLIADSMGIVYPSNSSDFLGYMYQQNKPTIDEAIEEFGEKLGEKISEIYR